MNPSTALATAIVGALLELDVRHVVLCPGSRSAPLAYALANADHAVDPNGGRRIGLHVRIDERSAGFLALGLAKGARGSSAPAVVITTSGTAVANLHPAVLEASHAGVPLLVISADRPHELRGTGANQTTDQVKLFGAAVRWFGEIPAPQRRVGQVPAWRNVVARAVAAARGNPGGHPGPVQLNVAFGEPLTPEAFDDGGGSDGTDGADGMAAVDCDSWPEPLTGTAGLTAVAAAAEPVAVTLPAGPRTVVLAGDGAGPAAAMLARAAGWPLLAEPSSGARVSGAIGPYRLLLDLPDLGGRIERVVVYGRPTLSRPVTRLLARDDVESVVVSVRPDWTDAARRACLVVPAVRVEPDAAAGRWLAAWQAAGGQAATAIDRLLDHEATTGRLTGPIVAREVAAATRSEDSLVVGSSNPIRDLDLTAGPFGSAARVLANRGLAGIDGTLSTASGVALSQTAGQVRCLVGDLTFLHDVGGLLVGALERRPDLQIVVVDDGGGGIFGLLEHGDRAQHGPEQSAIFERVFGTPQIADLAALCAGFGVEHHLVDDVDALRKALADPPPGSSIIQVRIDRAAHRDLADRLRTEAHTAVEGPAGPGIHV
jgi:2-succinyl-5-enolpyruvyl-6-hydroxy-3-cyclohexene-1-carboxylate synthase